MSIYNILVAIPIMLIFLILMILICLQFDESSYFCFDKVCWVSHIPLPGLHASPRSKKTLNDL